MTKRENLFRPVHKGIRAMLYRLGERLGAMDFANVAESNAFLEELKHDLTSALSNCPLCLLQIHSRHEERDFFAAVRPFDSDVVDLMLKEHGQIVLRTHALVKTCEELERLTDPARRMEVGDRLYLETNDLFSFDIQHMDNEEATLVPVMWERFTDEQLRALRAQFYNSIPLAQFEKWMAWTLPALNPNELTVLLSGMKTDPGPNRFPDAMRIAEATLTPARWNALQAQVGS